MYLKHFSLIKNYIYDYNNMVSDKDMEIWLHRSKKHHNTVHNHWYMYDQSSDSKFFQPIVWSNNGHFIGCES